MVLKIISDTNIYSLIEASQTCRIKFALGGVDKSDLDTIRNIMPWVFCREYFNECLPTYLAYTSSLPKKFSNKEIYGFKLHTDLIDRIDTTKPLYLSIRPENSAFSVISTEKGAYMAANLLADLMHMINPDKEYEVSAYLVDPECVTIAIPNELIYNPLLFSYYTFGIRAAVGLYATNDVEVASFKELFTEIVNLVRLTKTKSIKLKMSSGDYSFIKGDLSQYAEYNPAKTTQLLLNDAAINAYIEYNTQGVVDKFKVLELDMSGDFSPTYDGHEFGWLVGKHTTDFSVAPIRYTYKTSKKKLPTITLKNYLDSRLTP